jgi:hypothetical protein
MTTDRKNFAAERKGTVGFRMHRPGSNLTLVGVCPPITQTGPEIFFLRRHTIEEAERFNKGRRTVRLRTYYGSLTWGESSMSSAIVTSCSFIMFYYLSVQIQHTAGQAADDRRFAKQIVRLIVIHLSHAR